MFTIGGIGISTCCIVEGSMQEECFNGRYTTQGEGLAHLCSSGNSQFFWLAVVGSAALKREKTSESGNVDSETVNSWKHY
jgi:hypothetical protein